MNVKTGEPIREQNVVEEHNLEEEEKEEEEEEEEEIIYFFQTSENNLANELVLDSGASSHMIKNGKPRPPSITSSYNFFNNKIVNQKTDKP